MKSLTDYDGRELRVEFLKYEDNYQDECRKYWFNVGGEIFGAVFGISGCFGVVDGDNYPVNTDDAEYLHLSGLYNLVTEEMKCDI